MISRLMTACAIMALGAGTQASAQNLPAWTPQAICTEDATPEHCRFLEAQAQSQISQQWQFIPSLVRDRCLTASEEQGTTSWRLFGGCLADAARPPRAGGVQLAAVSGAEGDATVASDENAPVLLAQVAENGDERVATAQARIEELEAELAKATTRQKSADARIEGLQQRLMEAQDAAANAESDGEAESARIAELEAELEATGTEVKRGNARIEGLQTRLLGMLDADVDGADVTGTETDAPDPGAARIAELEEALDTAAIDNDRSTARIEGLQQRLVEMGEGGVSDAEVAAMQDRLDIAESRIANLSTRLRTSRDTVRTLEQEKAAAMGNDDAPDAEVTAMQNSLDSAQARIANLTDRLGNTGNTIRRLHQERDAATASSGADTAALESRLDVAEGRIANLTTRLRNSRDIIRTLEQEKSAAMEVAAAPGAAAAGMQDRLETAESRIANLSNRLRTSRDAVRAANEERGRVDSNLANARARIASLQDAMIESRTETQAQIAALTEQAATATAPTPEADGDAAATAERLQRLLDNQRERSARVSGTVSEQRARIRELENEARTLRRVAQTAGARTCQDRMAEIVAENGIQFANNKSEIRADAAAVINRLIAVARGCEEAQITVRGHTDSMGEESYNVYLSELRAAAVVDYMTRNGIAPVRINSVGVGPAEPIADNRTRAGRAQNRRIEIVVQ